LERLLLLQRRQDPGQPTGEHRLARAGRASEQQVVTAGSREFECTPSAFLTADIRKIERAPPRLAVADDVLRRLELSAEVRDRVRKMAHSDGLDPCQGSLGTRFVRTDDALQLGTPRALGDGKHTADTTQAPVERELATRSVLREAVARKLIRRRQE